jgi:uncharacterized protein HemY
MDMHFILGLVAVFIVGFALGCVLTRCLSRRAHAKRSGSAGYLASSMISREALRKLEAGDSEGAKHELGFAVANFYCSFDGTGEPPYMAETIASERRQIEAQARSSAILADALKKRSNDESAA